MTIVNNGSESKRSRRNVMFCTVPRVTWTVGRKHENITVRMNGVQAEIRTGYLLKLSHLLNFVSFVIISILQLCRSERPAITAKCM